MKTQKLFLIPLIAIFLLGVVSASSVTISLFYDSTASNSLTIINGDRAGVIVSADSIFESSMTIMLDVLDSNGNLVNNVLDTYTTLDSYSNYFMVGQSAYLAPGNYTLRGIVTGASGQSDIYTLSLEVLPATTGNNAPIITSSPATQINELQNYAYQVVATDADNDALTYSLTQAPIWLSISNTGAVTGTAPDVTSDYSYAVTVSVSDGSDFVTQTFSLIVKDTNQSGDTTAPVITVVSPVNSQTYTSSSVSFEITLNENTNAAWYSLDGGANVALGMDSPTYFRSTVSLANGNHSVVFSARDTAGNVGQSNTINFVIDTTIADTVAPVVIITSPVNGATYNTRSISVSFTASDINLKGCSYILNNGSAIMTACSIPFTITALEGTNTLTLYASDYSDNIGSQTVTFTVDTISKKSSKSGQTDVADDEIVQYLSQFDPKTTTEDEEVLSISGAKQSSFWGNASAVWLSAGVLVLIVALIILWIRR